MRRLAAAALTVTLLAWPLTVGTSSASAEPASRKVPAELRADTDVTSDDEGYVRGTRSWGAGSRQKAKKGTARSTSKATSREGRAPNGDQTGTSSIVGTLNRATARQIARELIVHLQLPKPTPQFGPDPSDNEWNMMAVGYPIWLWTEGPTTVTASESAYGYTFTLRARYRSTSFDMGDGQTKQCTDTTVHRRSVKPGAKSPTCGYTYLKAARDGTYTVTATTHWDVDWSVAGFSGTLPGTHSASRELPVGELQAIVVK